MSTSVSIRTTSATDNILLAHLSSITFEQAFGPANTPEDMAAYLKTAFSPELQAAELADPNTIFWIVSVKENPIGYVKLNTGKAASCISKSKALKIARFYLVQEWWGKGIGNQLLQQIIDYARQQQFEAIWLTVWEQNPGAIKLYQKFGFNIVGDEDFVVGQDVQHDFIMEKVV